MDREKECQRDGKEKTFKWRRNYRIDFHVVHAVTPIPRSKSPLHLSLPPGINQNAMAASREKIRTVADSYLARQLQVPKINKHVPSGSRSLRGTAAAAADEVAL